MLTIRPQQIQALEALALEHFVAEVVRLLAPLLPTIYRALGEQRTWHVATRAAHRAMRYGLETKAGIATFIELTLILGPHFDTSPRYRWAARILGEAVDERHRVQQLHERALQYRCHEAEFASRGRNVR
ncbi:MAG: hypothetical protein K0V04_42845 [Deltaproteobacteria bacterium]|nr:hypothetical protein [Deltaproteobacteria bacterium]